MWERVKRLFRSIFGGIIDRAEDPELILQQVIRDMRDKIPQMNNNVAQVMATEKIIDKQVTQLEREVVELDSKIKAAIKMGRDDIATNYLSIMQEKQSSLTSAREQLETAKRASQQALKFRDNYMLEMKKRQAEAMQLINENKRAKMQEEIAGMMTSFQVGDSAGTFDDMRNKISEREAKARAKMELASSSVDSQMQEIEKEARNIEAQDALLAYKRQMGLVSEGPSPGMGETNAAPPQRAKMLE
ncbi:MAG: PspA/IM30 family protein [Blastocatellia bacterium]|nr:PspA/IM30 family protein [Blastocatellia bacterium]MBL8192314.1 PspA/IM30 family protein [Blastocatellia bacterium]MBN8721891.1 PspA/IM30 family protein [Acidobacteriota bacterium]